MWRSYDYNIVNVNIELGNHKIKIAEEAKGRKTRDHKEKLSKCTENWLYLVRVALTN